MGESGGRQPKEIGPVPDPGGLPSMVVLARQLDDHDRRDAAQRTLAHAFQRRVWLLACLREGRLTAPEARRARREVAELDPYVAELTDIGRRIVRNWLNKRWPTGALGQWMRTNRDEAWSAIDMGILEALASYRADKGRLGSWILFRVQRELEARRREDDPRIGSGPWRQVASVAHGIKAAADRDGNPLTWDEIQRRTERAMREKKRISAAAKHPDASPEELDRLAHEAMRKEGVAHAIRVRFADVINCDQTVLRLSAPIRNGEPGIVLGDTLAAPQGDDDDPGAGRVTALALDGLSPTELAVMTAWAELKREGKQNFARVAEAAGVDVTEARATIRRAKASVSAPHAQFARFAPGLDGQFESPPAPTPSVSAVGDVSALLARRRERIAAG